MQQRYRSVIEFLTRISLQMRHSDHTTTYATGIEYSIDYGHVFVSLCVVIHHDLPVCSCYVFTNIFQGCCTGTAVLLSHCHWDDPEWYTEMSLCEGNPPVSGGFPSQRDSNRSVPNHDKIRRSVDSLHNRVCHPGGQNWDYYAGLLFLSQVSATLEIGQL